MSSQKKEPVTIFQASLAAALKKEGWTQHQLAASTDIPRSRISEYSTGKTEPGMKNLEKIARAFRLTPAAFLALGEKSTGSGLALAGAPADLTGRFVRPAFREAENDSEPLDAFYFRLALQRHIQRDGKLPHQKRKAKDELVQASGLDRKLLNRIYLGQKQADPATMEILARAIDIPLADLLESGRSLAEQGRPINEPGPASPKAGPGPLVFRPRPLRVFGLVACNWEGWERKVPVSLSASPPVFGPNAFVVIASGTSMLPAGICPGMFCYCDPDVEPIEGDAVYIRQTFEDLATIKLFVGWGGGVGTREGWLKLRGWKEPDQWRRQLDFFMELPSELISELATVVCVRRRM